MGMSDQLLDPQGAEPANVPPSEPAGAEPQNTEAFAVELESMDSNELAKALGFSVSDDTDPNDTPAAPDPGAKEPNPDVPGAQPEPTDPQAPEPKGEEHKAVTRRRLSVTGLPDEDRALTAKAIDLVREGKAANIAEAILSLSGGTPAQSQASQPDPTNPSAEADPQPAPQAPPTLLELESRFEKANEELADAIRDFDQDKQIELTKEIQLLNRQILRAEQAEESLKAQVSNYQSDYQDAVTEMETKYADLLDDEESPFADLLDDKVEAARARKDPALSDPRFILSFADQIAAMVTKGVQPKAPAPVPQKPAKPVGAAVAPSHVSKPQLTGRQVEEFIQKAPTEVLAAALWG